MSELRELGYAWRDRSSCFSEHDALAQAIEQVVQQVRALPPQSTMVKPIEIRYEGAVEQPDDPTMPDQLYALYTSYSVPVY